MLSLSVDEEEEQEADEVKRTSGILTLLGGEGGALVSARVSGADNCPLQGKNEKACICVDVPLSG